MGSPTVLLQWSSKIIVWVDALGNIVFGDGGDIADIPAVPSRIIAKASTPDATPIIMAKFPIPASACGSIAIDLAGNDGSHSFSNYSYGPFDTFGGTFNPGAGGAPLKASTFTGDSVPAGVTNMYYNRDGESSLEIEITGMASRNINWSMRVEINIAQTPSLS